MESGPLNGKNTSYNAVVLVLILLSPLCRSTELAPTLSGGVGSLLLRHRGVGRLGGALPQQRAAAFPDFE